MKKEVIKLNAKTTLKKVVISQFGSITAYVDEYNKKIGKITYTSMLNRLNNPDQLTISTARKMISLLDTSYLPNPYSVLFD